MRFSRSLVVATVACVLILAFASPALALLETGDAEGTSAYNPNIGDNEYWRWNWGNSLQPDVTFTTIPGDSVGDLQGLGYVSAVEGRTQTTGFIYEMRQLGNEDGLWLSSLPTPIVGVSPRTGRNVQGAFQGTLKTLLVGSFNLDGLIDEFGWSNDVQHPGAIVPGEGVWGARFLFQNQYRTEEPSATSFRAVALGVDQTVPDSIRNLRVSYMPTRSATGWMESQRLNFLWDLPTGIADNYDHLSGVGGYSVAIDGSEIVFVTNTAPDPTFEPYAALLNPAVAYDPQLSNVTVESLPGGSHQVAITTVDRATNRSAAAALTTKVDYDTPTGQIIWTDSAHPIWQLGASGTVSVNTSDAAGISSVTFYLDGVPIGNGSNMGAGVWSLTRSFTGFNNGGHVLTALVRDMIGQNPPVSGSWLRQHAVTVAQNVSVDKTVPSASVKASSSKRTVTLKIKSLNKPATMVVTIDGVVQSAGSAVPGKLYTKKHAVPRRASGPRTRKVKWSVKLTDSVGNVRTYSGKSTVTYYYLKKSASNRVKAVVY